jgi:hypothetical protein
MLSRPEAKEEELERIARKYDVTVNSKSVSAAFWSRIGLAAFQGTARS